MLVTSIYVVTTYVALLMLIARGHTSLPSPGCPNRVEDERDLHGKSWVLSATVCQIFSWPTYCLCRKFYLDSYMPVFISAKLSQLAYFQPT